MRCFVLLLPGCHGDSVGRYITALAQGLLGGRTKCLKLGEMTVNQRPPHGAGVAIRCFHVWRGTNAGPGHVNGQRGHFPPSHSPVPAWGSASVGCRVRSHSLAGRWTRCCGPGRRWCTLTLRGSREEGSGSTRLLMLRRHHWNGPSCSLDPIDLGHPLGAAGKREPPPPVGPPLVSLTTLSSPVQLTPTATLISPEPSLVLPLLCSETLPGLPTSRTKCKTNPFVQHPWPPMVWSTSSPVNHLIHSH